MSAMCHRCGAIDPAGNLFRRERIPFRGTRVYCPACHARFENNFILAVMAINVVFGLIGVVSLWKDPRSPDGHVFVNLFLIVVLMWLSIVPHELAHAVVGKMAGLNVLRIWIGRGKTMYHARVFGFDTEFKVVPVGGLALLAFDAKAKLRLRYFLAVLAGPLSNAIILTVAWPFVSWRNFSLETSIQLAAFIVVAQMLILVENLLPYRIQTSLGTQCTDGLSLFQLLTSKSPEVFRWRSEPVTRTG